MGFPLANIANRKNRTLQKGRTEEGGTTTNTSTLKRDTPKVAQFLFPLVSGDDSTQMGRGKWGAHLSARNGSLVFWF